MMMMMMMMTTTTTTTTAMTMMSCYVSAVWREAGVVAGGVALPTAPQPVLPTPQNSSHRVAVRGIPVHHGAMAQPLRSPWLRPPTGPHRQKVPVYRLQAAAVWVILFYFIIYLFQYFHSACSSCELKVLVLPG
jgi:hypothetical protein